MTLSKTIQNLFFLAGALFGIANIYDFINWNKNNIEHALQNDLLLTDYETPETRRLIAISNQNNLNKFALVKPIDKNNFNFLVEVLINKSIYPESLSLKEGTLSEILSIEQSSLVLIYDGDIINKTVSLPADYTYTGHTAYNYMMFIKQ